MAYLGGGAEEKVGRVRLHEAGIPVFPTPERAVRAISAVVRYSLFRRNHRAVSAPGDGVDKVD